MKKFNLLETIIILLVLLIPLIMSCDKDETSTKKTTIGDIWGRCTREEYVNKCVSSSTTEELVRKFGSKEKDYKLQEFMDVTLSMRFCNCMYENTTKYLENKYGTPPDDWDFERDMSDEEYNDIIDECVDKHFKGH